MSFESQTPGGTTDEAVLPELADWLIAGLLTIVGLGMALGGSAILWVSGEDFIAEAIADGVAEGTVETAFLDQQTLTAVATDSVFWLGVGLLITGLGIVVAGILYLVARRRVRRSGLAGNQREFLLANGVVGAVVTGVVPLYPISVLVGGGVGAYLQRKRAPGVTKVGALSGLFVALPGVVIMAFLTIGLATGFSGTSSSGLGIVVPFAMVIFMLVVLVISVGFGALGGYLADAFLEEENPPGEDTETRPDEESTI